MQIYVKSLSGHTITLDVQPSDTIDELQQKLEDKPRGPFERVPERVKLVFGGKRLERGRPLADYGIKDESTLYLPDFTRCLPPPETLVHLMGNGNADEQKEAASGVATFATIMSPQRFQSLATRPGIDAP